MKYNIFPFLLCAVLCTCASSFSQTWNYVGSPKFSNGNVVGKVSIQTLPGGVPVVAYAQSNYDPPYIAGTFVRKYDGNDWVNLGLNPLSANNPDNVVLAVSGQGEVYVARTAGPSIHIYHLVNNVWDTIGNFLNNYSSPYESLSMKVAPDGTPYVVYTLTSPDLGKPICVKYNGTSWDSVGVNNGKIMTGVVDVISLDFDENGVPYVALGDVNNAGRISLYRYDSGINDWVSLSGSQVISGNDAVRVTLQIVSSSEMYIGAASRFFNPLGYYPAVVKYDGNTFTWLDSLNMSSLGTNPLRMHIQVLNGEVYRAYDKGYNTGAMFLEKYDGQSWQPVGNNLHTYPTDYGNQIVDIAFSNGVPVLAFTEWNNDGRTRASVISYGDMTLQTEPHHTAMSWSMYPNPADDILYIDAEQIGTVNIYDMSGRLLMSGTENMYRVSHLAAGTYVLMLHRKDGTSESGKLIIR